MVLSKAIALLAWVSILGMLYPPVMSSEDSIEFSVQYFKERRVKFVCAVICKNGSFWGKEFTKRASSQSIAASSFAPTSIRWRQDMERCLQQRYTPVGVVLDTGCGDMTKVLFSASENMWLGSKHVWLFLDESDQNVTEDPYVTHDGNGTDASKIVDSLALLNMGIDADIKISVKTDKLRYRIYDAFNFGKIQGGSLNIVDVGTWTPAGFSEDLNGCKYYRRWDFGQLPLRLVAVATHPETVNQSMLTSLVPVQGVNSLTRSASITLEVIAEIHNIKYVYSMVDRWNSQFEKDSVESASHNLYFRKQDLTAGLRIAEVYLSKLDFLYPSLVYIETRYYYRIPTSGPGRYENEFLRPLSGGVWWCVGVMIIVCTVLLAAAAKLERRPSPVQYSVFSVAANTCQQFFEDDSGELESQSTTGKLIIFVTGMSCVLIYNYYTSSVVSWLLNGPPPSLNSLQELLDSPLDLIYQDIGYTRSWLSDGNFYYNSKNKEVENKIRSKILKRNVDSILHPLEEGMLWSKLEVGYAYHTETDYANNLISKTFTQNELCELGSLPSLHRTQLYPGAQKNSPYKEFMNWSLVRLMERGILSCIQRRTASSTVSCEGTSPRALSLGGAAPAFIMLGFGYFISVGILLLERFIHKLTREGRALLK